MKLFNLLSRMKGDRFEPVVVSLMNTDTMIGRRIQKLGIPIYSLGMKAGMLPTPVTVWRLVNIVRKIQPDLIHGWMYHGILAAEVTKIFSTNQFTIWEIQTTIYSLQHEKKMSAVIIKLCALLSKLPARIIFVSQISKLQHEALGYYSKNNCLLPNGFDTSLFKPSVKSKLDVRKELGLPEESLLIGLFCRYHPMKDHANCIKAAALLLKEYPDVHFLLVGTEVDRNNQSLNELIQELGISEQIHLLGERSDIPRLSAALDIASSSSAYGEAFPMVIGEAMSCGIPCVVTDVGDSARIVDNTGYVVPPREPQALANAWKKMIELGSEGRKALGQAARERIINNFGLDFVVAQYESLYESVFAQKN
ncbi:glycosyltransferase [Pleurocapsales cyanobacterium LEGE 06147]|nr:glycosyltransferase [Pleurocapsales cyanobacterium LEGE 06147]